MPKAQRTRYTLNHLNLPELNLHSIISGTFSIDTNELQLSNDAAMLVKNSYIENQLILITNKTSSTITVASHEDWNFTSCCMITEGLQTDFLSTQESMALIGAE